jgi:hypothetical protein
MKYLNGQLTAEQPETPREETTPEERAFNAEEFSGTYSSKHYPEKQAGSRSVVIATKPYVIPDPPQPCADCGLNPCQPDDKCHECQLPLCAPCACRYDTILMCSACSLVHVIERRQRVLYRDMIELRMDAIRASVQEVA